MKYVFAMFDNAESAAEGVRRVQGHARVRRIGAAENLHAFGLDSTEERHFSDGLRRGATVLCAEVDDSKATMVAAELEMAPTAAGYGGTTGGIGEKARELKEQAKEKVAELRGRAEEKREEIRERVAERREAKGTLEEERTIPVIEEKMQIGKREVDRGAVRILTHVVSKPVDESVWLREEQIEIERRPIHRDVRTGEELGDRTLEVRAKGEEPVVQKTSEVVEEVRLKKQDFMREQKIHDSLKHTEVEVQKEQPRTSRPSSEARTSTESRPSAR